MNANYLIETPNDRWVLRIYGNKKREQDTRFERLMLRELAGHGFPCPKHQETIDGGDIISVSGRPAILYPFIDGKPATHGTPALLKEIGKLQGFMHCLFRGRRSPIKKERWDPEDIHRLIPRWRTRIIRSGFPDAKNFLDFIECELRTCHFPVSLPRGLTHQDIKPENVLVKNKRVAGILDFDNCYEGALLHDLTTTIIWWCFPKKRLDTKLVQSFLRGYETQRRLSTNERQLLLADGLRFRLLREMFIGPITTLNNIPLATKRAHYFYDLYTQCLKLYPRLVSRG